MPRELTEKFVVPSEKAQLLTEEFRTLSDIKNKIPELEYLSITEILEILITSWASLDVSDFHLEPKEEKAVIRYRIDGLLHEIGDISRKTYKNLVNRIKLLAGLKINIRDRAQDGRFSAVLGEKTLELRVSSLPSEFGETIVIRILDPTNIKSLEELGLRKENLEIIRKYSRKPEGMILTVGPTGSGKTTTLYAILKEVNKPEVKIITIEDPIEYRLPGISQTQVDPKKGYDFANGLRAIVRQDPDIILVGEIRDEETAEIAVQASLTGHLLLSTLHTQDTATTPWRLHSLQLSWSDITASLLLVIAQRLVRKVCPQCATERPLSEEEKKEIEEELQPLNIRLSPQQTVKEAKGCKECHFTGYKGRTGLFELMIMTERIQEKLLENPSILGFKKFLKEEIGQVSLKGDGFLKVLEGITTLEEVKRVAG